MVAISFLRGSLSKSESSIPLASAFLRAVDLDRLIEIHGKSEDRIGAVKLPTLALREIVLVFHRFTL